jgi:putative transposase
LLPHCDLAVHLPPEELALMRRIDELHLEMPYAGARMLSRILKREGQPVGRKHVSTLMQRMDIHALYRKPNTSKRHPAHKIYPYLLGNGKFCPSKRSHLSSHL